MPAQHANLSKNSTVPDVAGGILWPDEINKVFWLYGGEFSTAPSKFQLWGYDVLLDQWNLSSTTTSVPSVNRVSYGAGTTMVGKGYYYGGYLNNLTNPLWDGPPVATSTLVIFDMDSDTLTNNTGPDSIGRAEGVMVSIPTYSQGMLIYFGGVTFPFDNSVEVPMSMTDILLYDGEFRTLQRGNQCNSSFDGIRIEIVHFLTDELNIPCTTVSFVLLEMFCFSSC